MSKRIYTNIVVKIPNMASLLEQATKRYVDDKRHHYELVDGFRTVMGLGYIQTKDGAIYCIDKDGVGPDDPVNDKNPLLINLYPKLKEVDGSSFLVTEPGFTVNLRQEDILAFPVEKEEDLSEFIRSFGRRLEGNFQAWVEKLTPLV